VTNTRVPAPSLDRLSSEWSSGQYRVNVVRDILPVGGFDLKDRAIGLSIYMPPTGADVLVLY
jgi:hypothetical protein